MKIVTAVFLTLCLINCSSLTNDGNSAKSFNYYYEFNDEVQSDFSQLLIDQLEKNIGGNSYVITQSSGAKWPYFLKIVDPQRFPADSVLFPHPGLHKFVPYSKYQSEDGRHFKVEVTIVTANEREALFNEILYEKTALDNKWMPVVNVGPIKLHKTKEMNEQSFIHLIEEKIIFFTFK